MIMGKRYQRGEGGRGEKIRVSQFFSLTGRRDCVFLSSLNARKRNLLPSYGGEEAAPSGFRPPFRFTPGRTRCRNDAVLSDVFASEASSNCHPVDRAEFLLFLFHQYFAIVLILKILRARRKCWDEECKILMRIIGIIIIIFLDMNAHRKNCIKKIISYCL